MSLKLRNLQVKFDWEKVKKVQISLLASIFKTYRCRRLTFFWRELCLRAHSGYIYR